MHTEFFQGEGEVRQLLREFDWASSGVGTPETWPPELHTMMDLILQVQYPAVVLWGDDNLYWYNDAYIYLLGQRHPAALGKRFRDVWPELWPEIGPTIENAMAGVPAYFECVPFTCAPDGVPEERYFTLSFSPVRDRSGKVLGMLNAGFETTNRIAEERRIAFELALSDRFRALSSVEEIVAAASAMLGTELGLSRVMFAEVNDADGSYRIQHEWNPQGSPGNTGQLMSLDACDPDSIDRLRKGGTLILSDVPVPSHSPGSAGRQARAKLTVPVLRAGRLEMVLSVHCAEPRSWLEWEVRLVADVAQRTVLAVEAIRAQAAVRASEAHARRLAEDLANENRRKSDFLAVLAHELRNPLAPIRTGLDIIRMRSDNPEAVLRVRDMIERQTTHMIHLIDDLLDVARITTGKIELKKTVVDLNEIVASAVETSLPAIEKAHHELRLNLHDGPLLLEADEVRIGQVIGNLLTNAAKYTPQGGKISLSVTTEGGAAVVAVSDNGIGIPSEALETVFDMFKQVERSLGHSQGGLGIGLSLVRQLASLHGGSVNAASEGEGKGSTFTVRLPIGVSAHSAVQGSERSPAEGAKPEVLRVLVVDDNADAADSLAGLLRLRGHETRVAYSGAEAIALAQVLRPDLAFLDIGMPDMSGYDVARRLRKEPGLEQMMMTALTGWGTDADRARSADAGFNEHLIKPMTSAVLDALLEKVTGSI